MTTLLQNTSTDYTRPASPEQIQTTLGALNARGISAELVNTAADALERVKALIPAGASVMTAGSATLQHIGLEAMLIAKAHPWVNLKDSILAEKDPAAQKQLRLQSVLAPYYLGSVQAIAQTGEIVVASGSGSQLPSYAFSSSNVIWVAGVQKIVPTLEDALRRVREYSLPQEDARMKSMGYPGSMLAKILIVEKEPPFAYSGRKVNLILVNEPVGV